MHLAISEGKLRLEMDSVETLNKQLMLKEAEVPRQQDDVSHLT